MKNFLFVRALLCAVMAAAAVSFSFALTPNYDVYLLIGQSNMAGRGPMLASDTTEVIDGVWLLNGAGEPEPAVAPLNKYSTIRKDMSLQGYNPGNEFSRLMHARSGNPILLVVNARGGSSIVEWQPGAEAGYLAEAVKRARQAMGYGTLKSILWNQGETDVQKHTPDYAGKFKNMINVLRSELHADSVPVVMGQVGRWNWAPKADIKQFNDSVVPRACKIVPLCSFVSSDGLSRRYENKERDPHYSRDAQIELGRRYAEAMK